MVDYDLDNERAIIISALTDADCRRAVVGSVRPEDFLGERFRVIFRAIKSCYM